MLLSPTGHFWPHPSVCSHPAGMLWELLPREWGVDPGEDPSCHPLFHCICLPQTGSAGDHGQVDTTGGFVPTASSWGQAGLPGTGNCCHHSSLLLPKPPYLSSPATSSQLSSSPHLHPHLHPLKDMELPGLNMMSSPLALPMAGPFPSLSPLVPHCPFAHT